jgi:hypothetical protein
MPSLSSAVCSITATQRRRFFWAAWWTASPRYAPFQKPDASNGGARTLEEALADAERVAGRHLTLIEPHWARAWNKVLRGEASPTPPPSAEERALARPRERAQVSSPWTLLELEPGATSAEIKRAYRKRALETHPDQGGDADSFRQVHRAYQKLIGAADKRAKVEAGAGSARERRKA